MPFFFISGDVFPVRNRLSLAANKEIKKEIRMQGRVCGAWGVPSSQFQGENGGLPLQNTPIGWGNHTK